MNVNPEALVRPELDTGVPSGDLLLAFAVAIIGTDRKALGPAAVSGASAVAGNFSKNDRVANGIGIPVDEMIFNGTEELREQLGLNDYKSAENTFRHM
jgi:hypothetical protein